MQTRTHLFSENWTFQTANLFLVYYTLLNEAIGFCENLHSSLCQTEPISGTSHAHFNLV